MENSEPTPPAKRRRPGLRAAWCECAGSGPEVIDMPDRVCPCGVGKHHDRCTVCPGVAQVG